MLTPLALILIFFFLCFFGIFCMYYHSLRTHERAMQQLMREQQLMRDALEHVLLLLTHSGIFDQHDEQEPEESPPAPFQHNEDADVFNADAADNALVQATARPAENYLSMDTEKIPMPKPGGPDRLEL